MLLLILENTSYFEPKSMQLYFFVIINLGNLIYDFTSISNYFTL